MVARTIFGSELLPSNYYQDLSAEAARVLEIARSTHPPGRLATALYKSGGAIHEHHTFNVNDLQLTVTVRGLKYYLYSVHVFDQWQDQKARSEAIKRQKTTLAEIRKEVDFKKRLGAEIHTEGSEL